jgi:hypothetical protein
LQAGPAEERHLVCLDDLLQAAQDQDAQAWRDALADLENRWFAPLKTALAKGRLSQLEVVAGTSYGDLTWQASPRQIKGGLFSFLAGKPEALQQLARRLAAA